MPALYKIADLIVSMEHKGNMSEARSKPYRLEDKEAYPPVDIVINIAEESILNTEKKHPEMDYENWEYMLAGSSFYRQLLRFDGALLHASAVVVDNQAFLFSAASGTGKSTHTKMWLKHFGDRAYILNDDKPAIRFVEGAFYAYGTPFSGKDDISRNAKVPLAGIAFLERSDHNYIAPMDNAAAIMCLFEQTVRDINKDKMEKLFDLMEKLLKTVPIYRFGCTISEEAVILAYETMKKH